MKIPDKPRYDYVCKMTYEFFLEHKISSFPIDPFTIIEKNKWGLTSYSELSTVFNCTVDDVAKCLKSKDGYTQFDSINYSIAYNDMIETPRRIPFTLMHEIGHIYLKHLEDFKETTILRNELSTKEYQVLEKEANAFARNILAPAPVVQKLKNANYRTLSKLFGLSKKASKTRLSILGTDLNTNQSCSLTPKILELFNNFMNKKHCPQCGYSDTLPNANYCPICGSKKLQWRDGNMIYNDGYDIDKNSKVKICPICKNEEIEPDGEYCGICGTYLVNRCMNSSKFMAFYDYRDTSECGKLAKGNHAYCIHCGSITTFNHFGLLKSWEERKKATNNMHSLQDDDLPF